MQHTSWSQLLLFLFNKLPILPHVFLLPRTLSLYSMFTFLNLIIYQGLIQMNHSLISPSIVCAFCPTLIVIFCTFLLACTISILDYLICVLLTPLTRKYYSKERESMLLNQAGNSHLNDWIYFITWDWTHLECRPGKLLPNQETL